MPEFINLLGLQGYKPVLTALLLPPVPFILSMLIGARWLLWRRKLGWLVVLASVAALWLHACQGWGRFLERSLLHIPAALSPQRIDELKNDSMARASTAIVVLGGGREAYAPEYDAANLSDISLERLRYGVWLSRATGSRIAFSGGSGWGQSEGPPEADIAARIAEHEFGHPLDWLENTSRDTRENASHALAILQPAGIHHIILVTHGWHMPRAFNAFQQASQGAIHLEAAPMGLGRADPHLAIEWLPTTEGFFRTRRTLREFLGRSAGF